MNSLWSGSPPGPQGLQESVIFSANRVQTFLIFKEMRKAEITVGKIGPGGKMFCLQTDDSWTDHIRTYMEV